MERVFQLFLPAVLLLFPPVVTTPPQATEDPFEVLRKQRVAPSALLAEAARLAPELSKDPRYATRGRGITLCTGGTEEERHGELLGMVKQVDDFRKALLDWNMVPPADLPATVVLLVHVPWFGESVLEPAPGVLFVRRGIPGSVGGAGPPPIPAREGKGLDLGQVADASTQHNRWRGMDRASRSASGPGSLPWRLALRLVTASVPDGTPAWFRTGLASATLERSLGQPVWPAEPHIPGAFLQKAGAVEALFDDEAIPISAAGILGRVVGRVLDSASDRRAVHSGLPGASSGAGARSLFGAPLPGIITAAVAPGPGNSTCDDKGRVRCPLCRGLGRVEVNCGVCAGTGALVCPSCEGKAECRNELCRKGTIRWETGRESDCKACTKGVAGCRACGGKGNLSCRPCQGEAKLRLACPICAGGFLPCTDCPSEPGSPCPQCPSTGVRACPSCPGAGPLPCQECRGTATWGCGVCHGPGRIACPSCSATGLEIGKYTDNNTIAYTRSCGTCSGIGWKKCAKCKGAGCEPCLYCKGKGTTSMARCAVCKGTATRPCVSCGDPLEPLRKR